MVKNNRLKKGLFLLILFFISLFIISGCKQDDNNELIVEKIDIIHEPEFGGVYIKMTIDEFNKKGFEYGDSVNVTFSNGYKLENIPYYNGYYTNNNEPLLIAYPGYDFIKAAINNGADLWEVAELDENAKATISLNKKAVYTDIQNARDIHYLDDRSLYPSDEVFANFRSLKGGNLKDNYLYRSASPCDNQHNRASYVDQLIEANGVRHIVNLADNDDKIKGYMAKDDFNSEYFETLFNKDDLDNDHVDALALNMNFESDYFKGQVINALIAIKNNEGPILIHCTEGKDRTGFVCMLIEALAGASFLEIEEDYMMTYFNYYAITKAFEEVKYNTIVDNVLVPMIESLGGGEAIDVKNTDLAILAKNYLLRNGMSENDINGLLEVICQNK